jgi:hypothetical protein
MGKRGGHRGKYFARAWIGAPVPGNAAHIS